MWEADNVFAFLALVIAAVFSISESINNSNALAEFTVKEHPVLKWALQADASADASPLKTTFEIWTFSLDWQNYCSQSK